VELPGERFQPAFAQILGLSDPPGLPHVRSSHQEGSMSQHAHLGGAVRWRARPNALPRRRLRPLVLAFAVAFAGTLVVAMLQGEKQFFTDSAGYWGLGTTFTVSGHFSLLNFSDASKGYALPLINYGLQTLARGFAWTSSFVVKLFEAFTFAAIGGVLAPALIRAVWPSRPSWGLGRRLALTALLIVFWSGFLNVPLSDFPALAMALLTLVAVARTDSPGWMLLAGAALGLTIDIRESYLPFALGVVAVVAWTWFEERGAPHASSVRRALCVGMLAVGFAVVSLPQSLSAHRHHGTWSFIPGASISEPAGVYYASGVAVQSYDTYVLNGEARVEMKYVYPAGLRLLNEQPEGKITSTSQYVGLYLSHPLVMGGMIVSHIVNGLDPLYSTPYVENLHNAGRTLGRIAGFLLLFAALLRVLWPAARRLLGPGRLRYLLALLLGCVSTVPTEMERRYLLPVYLLIYALALTPGWPNPLGGARTVGLRRRFQTPAIIAVAFVAYASFVWYITSDAISHLTLVDGVTRETLNIQ
jgi:hypothetical protein